MSNRCTLSDGLNCPINRCPLYYLIAGKPFGQFVQLKILRLLAP